MLRSFFCIQILLFLLCLQAKSQVAVPEVDFLSEALKNAKREYVHRIGYQSLIYNGAEYVDYDNKINGHPYFDSEYYETGSLTYDGMYYDSMYMKYDVVKHLLVLRYYDEKGYKKDITVHNGKVDEFNLLGHHFIHVKDTSDAKTLDPGFYDVLYDDEFTLLSKRIKVHEEKLDGNSVKKRFYPKDQFFILKDGVTTSVKNKKDILKAFYERKKELQKYIGQNFIDFRNDFENSLLLVAEYYRTLND